MTKDRFKYYDDRTRPEPVVVPPDFPVTRLPPGVASGTEQRRSGDPDNPSKASQRLLKVSVRCEKCGAETSRMLNRRQLRNARIKCECGASVGFSWDAVRRG
jgi:hypothetical protein